MSIMANDLFVVLPPNSYVAPPNYGYGSYGYGGYVS